MTNEEFVRVARISEVCDGRYYISDDASNYLDQSGYGYMTRRSAIWSLRNDDLFFSHYLTESGKKIKISHNA